MIFKRDETTYRPHIILRAVAYYLVIVWQWAETRYGY